MLPLIVLSEPVFQLQPITPLAAVFLVTWLLSVFASARGWLRREALLLLHGASIILACAAASHLFLFLWATSDPSALETHRIFVGRILILLPLCALNICLFALHLTGQRKSQ